MRIAIIGASGFVGRYLTESLIRRGAMVTATYHSRLPEWAGANTVRWKQLNWKSDISGPELSQLLDFPDKVIVLAWEGLPHFKSPIHIKEALPASILFLNRLKEAGIRNITVTGTCLEYGLMEGNLHPDGKTKPVTWYGVAKDLLRQYLMSVSDFEHIQWFRIFYVYGIGQTEKSLYPQILRAVEQGSRSFDLSPGDQKRDFIPIEEAADMMSKLVYLAGSGIYNIGSGQPQSVLEFVENQFSKLKYNISMNPGVFSYPDYEPKNFWADISNHPIE